MVKYHTMNVMIINNEYLCLDYWYIFEVFFEDLKIFDNWENKLRNQNYKIGNKKKRRDKEDELKIPFFLSLIYLFENVLNIF